MGQKVSPIGFRLGVTRTWESRWYNPRSYVKFLHEDVMIRRVIHEQCESAGVAKIEIERASNRVKVTIHAARPGIIIGRKGESIEKLRRFFQQRTGKQVAINIEEIKKADTVAQLVAENVANQLLRRIGFRRAMKRTVLQTMKAGAQGVKVMCAGRLGGAEMSRREWYREGRVPLHTLRADIDYGFTEARTKYGQIGVKVWIFNGEIFDEDMAHGTSAMIR
ncbi:30S ribosomal protein S3 [Candidatus Sumerlaeota bacterium]|nr:30S ribosomal protein S3 [Candidatus Sumerlaeota bacterium]